MRKTNRRRHRQPTYNTKNLKVHTSTNSSKSKQKGVNTGVPEGRAVPASCKTIAVFLFICYSFKIKISLVSFAPLLKQLKYLSIYSGQFLVSSETNSNTRSHKYAAIKRWTLHVLVIRMKYNTSAVNILKICTDPKSSVIPFCFDQYCKNL